MPASRSRSPATSPLDSDAPPVDSIVALTQALVRAPSRAGRDRYDDVVNVMSSWLDAHGVRCERLADADGHVVALTASVGRSTGKRYLLDATLDTAPFGDRRRWAAPPASGTIRDGWLYGRGAADSKAGAALFAHLAAVFAHSKIAGGIALLFDLDEHSGAFSGVKRYVETQKRGGAPAGAFIGYPGNERIVIGGRGFARARVRVHGVAAHSGSHSHQGVNAATRAARLVVELARAALPGEATGDFPLPPKITVTGVHGGESFSVVPDVCTIDVDVRTTPRFTSNDARATMSTIVDSTLPDETGVAPTEIEWLPDSWPPYRINDDAPIARALRDAASAAFGRDVPTTIAGPSNIGNYLAQLGVPAIAGFGVTARNIHGSDECIDIASIAPVWMAYRNALASLLR